jgi:hypothetical protein
MHDAHEMRAAARRDPLQHLVVAVYAWVLGWE